MFRQLVPPIICLITPGETTSDTTPADIEFKRLVELAARAADARISIFQLREKSLTTRVLYELAVRCAEAVRDSRTLILVNDRADVARAAGCHGVHLTTRSLEAAIIRNAFASDFVVGVSTHTLEEARAARDGGANFALFGPVFDTPSKRAYGPPVGLDSLREASQALAPFPLLALGGINEETAAASLRAGAAGLAAIRLFADEDDLKGLMSRLSGIRT